MGTVLHDSVIGEGPDVVLLHGLFGQGSNLGMVARGLQGTFRVHSPDLPDHGRSAWSAATPSIPLYAKAIIEWMTDRHIERAHFVGHSLGGKVAMQVAFSEPSMVDKLVVADIAPISYPPGHDRVFAGLAAVASSECATRQDAARVLEQHIHDPAVIQFLLLSLQRTSEGHYQWRLNREGLEEGYGGFRAAPDLIVPFDGDALFIHGADSDYVESAGIAAIREQFAHPQIVALSDTGHWLHAEKTQEFNAAVLEFLA